jgi:hypothetical protein
MREQNEISSQVLQSLNQLHRQARNISELRQDKEEIYHERRGNCKRVAHSRSVKRTQRNHSPP